MITQTVAEHGEFSVIKRDFAVVPGLSLYAIQGPPAFVELGGFSTLWQAERVAKALSNAYCLGWSAGHVTGALDALETMEQEQL